MTRFTLTIFLLPLWAFISCSAAADSMTENQTSQRKNMALKGWNTWNNPNLLSFVNMPDGLSLRVTYRQKRGAPYWLEQSYIVNDQLTISERITPIAHAYDGSYIEMELNWAGIRANIKAAHDQEDIVILVTPLEMPKNHMNEDAFVLVLEASVLWNKSPIQFKNEGDFLTAKSKDKEVIIRSTSDHAGFNFPLPSVHLSFKAGQITAFYTGKERTLDQIEAILQTQEQQFHENKAQYGELKDAYAAMQAALAWNVFYDALNDRVLTSVSRIWNETWGGYIIFDWDTYFAALMLALDQKELAYANAIAMTNSLTEEGFVPNVEAAFGAKSFDRSQPPVGSMCCKLIYDKYGEKWFLEEVYDNLLTWNRWWDTHRNNRGFLSWGSNPHPKGIDKPNTKEAAMLESGLDNSPKFDFANFNVNTHMLELTSVGLMGLYIADCNYLAEMANILGRTDDENELLARSAQYSEKLQELWDDDRGIFRDRYLDRDEWSNQFSPANFYPLIAGAATQQQAETMIEKFFMNPDEFNTEYILPSIARSSHAFQDNDYWRGRIWAPMNFLVYMGLRNYDLPEARKMLVNQSLELILKEWRENRHVYENYNSVTGQGGDVRNSDPFYSWGGLLAFIALMEEGYFFHE